MIPHQRFLEFKCPVWVPVRAQQNGPVHGIVQAVAVAVAVTDHTVTLISATGDRRSKPIVVCIVTRSACKHRDRDPRSGIWQPPPGQFHAHFAE